jgi:membrane protein DedA with SNARE-associated domain
VLIDTVELLVRSYGYWFVALGAFLEGETVILMAGFAAYRGYLDIRWVVAVTFIGALAGDQLHFHLGRWKGASFLEKYALWRAHVGKVRRLMQRYGLLVIFGFRFIYGARTVTPFVIGSSGFDGLAFLAIDAMMVFFWSCLIAYLGYAFGAFIQVFFGRIKRIEHIVLLLLLLAGAVVWAFNLVRKWRSGRKRA